LANQHHLGFLVALASLAGRPDLYAQGVNEVAAAFPLRWDGIDGVLHSHGSEMVQGTNSKLMGFQAVVLLSSRTAGSHALGPAFPLR
jgi:hypothetical protein